MADGLCDWEDGIPHARNHILTTLNPPSTVELCDDHYGPGMIPLLAAELGLDPGEFYASVERYVKREQAKAAAALAKAEAAEAAGQVPGAETFHAEGRDLRAERKAGIDGEDQGDDAAGNDAA